MASIPNDTILRPGFGTTVHQFWVSPRVTSSSQMSGTPNFTRKSDGWARLDFTRVLMFRFFTRIGMMSIHLLPSSSTQSLWGWVLRDLASFRKLIFSLRSMSPLFMVSVLQRVSWAMGRFNRRLGWWHQLVESATSQLVLLLHAACWCAATCIDASTLLTLFLRLAGCFWLTTLFKK